MTLPRVVVVTGTGTEVGKTVASAALAALARRSGRTVALVKPVQTGLAPGVPGDVDEAGRLAGVADVHEAMRLPDPLAPDTAARRAGVSLPAVADVAGWVGTLSRQRDLVVVEGAGGLLVRLDLAGGTLADLATLLLPDVAVLVVAAAGLGTLNATELTVEALRSRRLPVLGVVIGSWPADPGLAERCNLVDLPRVTGVPLLGALPEGAGRLNHDRFAPAAADWLAPALGGRWEIRGQSGEHDL